MQLKLFNKNDIIQAINEIRELDMFKSLFKKKETKMDKEEMKSLFMECLTELKAANEAEKEDMKEEDEAENKCKNEEPDYKKMYEELKAKCEKAEKVEKAENSLDESLEILHSAGKVEAKIDYITEKRAKELGKELF